MMVDFKMDGATQQYERDTPYERELEPTNRVKCEVWSRIVGYLRPVKDWNEGKVEEFKDRKPFKLEDSKDE